jgi:hypothetical protein
MSKELNDAQKPEGDSPASGLLLSVEPISEGTPVSFAPLGVDDDKAPSDSDGTDTAGDTDTTDDADGTDGGDVTADGDGTDGTDGDGTDAAG